MARTHQDFLHHAAGLGAVVNVNPRKTTGFQGCRKMRFYFLATTVEENLESTEGEFGPNFDFYLKPPWKQHRWGVFRLDESKNRPLTLRVRYRYLPQYTSDASNEHRGVMEATARYPLRIGVLVSDRNRMDLRSIESKYSWRYRNFSMRDLVERERTHTAIAAATEVTS